jgi:ribosomal protein S18 acetylase RimI-like enzyme
MFIRAAQPEDAPILAQAERAIARTPGRLASRPEELQDEAFRERIAALSTNDCACYVVLEDGGAILGHASLEPLKLAVTAHVVVLTIAVHEGHQGKGIGKILMTHLLNWARAHPKVEKVELQVRSSNSRAIRLYESLGFNEEGRKLKRLKYGPNDYQDDLYMGLWVG